MHLSATRVHAALPRAVAVAVVAVPEQRSALRLLDRDAVILFMQRDTALLDAERVLTDLGPALVTAVEQTVLDLSHRPGLGGLEAEAHSSAQALLSRADSERLERLARQQHPGAALKRARTSLTAAAGG